MKEDQNGILELENVLPIEGYTFRRHGSSVLIYAESEDTLLCQFNPFDNTVFICDPRGFSIADLLGTKRFIVGTARKLFQETELTTAVNFARDLSFPLTHMQHDFPASLNIVSDAKNHSELSDMLVRSSGFTPQKIEEYKKGGDALCRFNPTNRTPMSGTLSCHVFLADKLNQEKIVGIMVADIIITDSELIDIYLRDEIVEQPCTLEHLFAATQQVIHQTFDKMNIDIHTCSVNAFIRAAKGKEESYKALGCSDTNPGIYVIHGPRTALAEMLDAHIKSIMLNQEKALTKPFVAMYSHTGRTQNEIDETDSKVLIAENRKFHFFH